MSEAKFRSTGRKIIATEFYTLDVLMSDPKDEMQWVFSTFSEELGKYEDEMYDRTDTLILGRVTYKIFESYWPAAAENPSAPDYDMTQRINKATKIVYSRSLKEVTWKNSFLIKEINPDEIKKLKKEKGKDILIVGSANIVQRFTNLDLIDEYHFIVHPVILGEGKPLFDDTVMQTNLKLSGQDNLVTELLDCFIKE